MRDILGLALFGLILFCLGGAAGQRLMERDMQRQAVERGVAEYTVDNEGNVSWDWIEEESDGND